MTHVRFVVDACVYSSHDDGGRATVRLNAPLSVVRVHAFRFDQTGDDVVDHREFLCGVSPLIPGTVQEKLEFAFMVFDVSGAGIMRPHEMLFVLKSEFPCRCTSRL
mmetsp:Transcript_4676/g.9148  ORF Transcript_4676/g.9148 Transcript_4676/m.9148 type:complete len:106 (-) Transcript_4676:957-1274(-)